MIKLYEVEASALAPGAWCSPSGHTSMEHDPRWLALLSEWTPRLLPGLRLSLLAHMEGDKPIAVAPVVRVDGSRRQPFPFDVRDLLFGIWARHPDGRSRDLVARACAARFLDWCCRIVGVLDRSLVVHTPLASTSDLIVRSGLEAGRCEAAVRQLISGLAALAQQESRALVIPRLDHRNVVLIEAVRASAHLSTTYPNAEMDLARPPHRRLRQALRRNQRLCLNRGVQVSRCRTLPQDFDLCQLYHKTAARYSEPPFHLDDTFLREASLLPLQGRFYVAWVQGRPASFVWVCGTGRSAQALKAGTDRELLGQTPAFLDLLFREVRQDASASLGADHLALGCGHLTTKLKYGASIAPVWLAIATGRGGWLASSIHWIQDGVGRGLKRVLAIP